MTQKAKIYVVNDKPRSETVLNDVKADLAKEYGGFTTYQAKGGWVNDKGELVYDNITVVETVGDIDKNHIRDLADYVRFTLNEKSVMWEIQETNVNFEEKEI